MRSTQISKRIRGGKAGRSSCPIWPPRSGPTRNRRGRDAIPIAKKSWSKRHKACSSVVEEDGFEPSKAKPADLQSVPFGHLGTPPYSVGRKKVELVDGFEPPTC